MMPEYDAIRDWSPEARRRLVEERGAEIRELLDIAFTDFADRFDLAPFGFRAADPVDEALAWCVERFASDRDIDPSQLRAPSFKLFTQPHWWLSQKVGKLAYARIRGQQQGRLEDQIAAGTPDAEAAAVASARDDKLKTFRRALAGTMWELYESTCPDIVGFWLRGTEWIRAHLFRWLGRGQLSAAAGGARPSRASKHRADAMFRFMVLRTGALEADPCAAVRLTMFSPCDNKSPYRVADRDAASRPELRPVTSRKVAAQRRSGCVALLARLVRQLEGKPARVRDRLEWVLGLTSVSLTTVAALGIESEPGVSELKRQLERLPHRRDLVAALEAVDVR